MFVRLTVQFNFYSFLPCVVFVIIFIVFSIVFFSEAMLIYVYEIPCWLITCTKKHILHVYLACMCTATAYTQHATIFPFSLHFISVASSIFFLLFSWLDFWVQLVLNVAWRWWRHKQEKTLKCKHIIV